MQRLFRIHILKIIFEELLKFMHPKVLMEKVERLHRIYSQQCWKCLSQMKAKHGMKCLLEKGSSHLDFNVGCRSLERFQIDCRQTKSKVIIKAI